MPPPFPPARAAIAWINTRSDAREVAWQGAKNHNATVVVNFNGGLMRRAAPREPLRPLDEAFLLAGIARPANSLSSLLSLAGFKPHPRRLLEPLDYRFLEEGRAAIAV